MRSINYEQRYFNAFHGIRRFSFNKTPASKRNVDYIRIQETNIYPTFNIRHFLWIYFARIKNRGNLHHWYLSRNHLSTGVDQLSTLKKRFQQLEPWLLDIRSSRGLEQSPANEEHRFSLDPLRMCSVWSLVQSIRTDFSEITYIASDERDSRSMKIISTMDVFRCFRRSCSTAPRIASNLQTPLEISTRLSVTPMYVRCQQFFSLDCCVPWPCSLEPRVQEVHCPI